MKRFFFLVAAIAGLVFLGSIQHTPLARIYGVKANIILVCLVIVGAFIERPLLYAPVLLAGGIIFRMGGGVGEEVYAFLAIAAVVFFARRSLPWKPFINSMVLVAVSTILFYAVAAWQFLLRAPGTVGIEAAYNVIAAACLYALMRIAGYEQTTRIVF